ncbi:MAG: YgiT-type zinc finger protein [Candidatus Hydrogenedentes bacterium]|nr:YgiT-type zinc finger protein [Candidatus Hydrogenedentota bacterium]
MKTIRITVCPTCGSGKIRKMRGTWTGRFRGHSYTVPSLEFYECPVCGERVYDREAMRMIEDRSPAFTKVHSGKGHTRTHRSHHERAHAKEAAPANSPIGRRYGYYHSRT